MTYCNVLDEASLDLSVSRTDLSKAEAPLPDWVTIGESVQIRFTSSTGIIAYIGPVQFASGTWIGVALDAPTGTIII